MLWAVAAWVAGLLLVFVVAQLLGLDRLGGYVGLAAFLAGYGVGGVRGGLTGRREWVTYVAALSCVAFLAFGMVTCGAAMLTYG